MPVKPWRQIATPHPDVLEGTFQQSEFAADITAVHTGKASRVPSAGVLDSWCGHGLAKSELPVTRLRRENREPRAQACPEGA